MEKKWIIMASSFLFLRLSHSSWTFLRQQSRSVSLQMETKHTHTRWLLMAKQTNVEFNKKDRKHKNLI